MLYQMNQYMAIAPDSASDISMVAMKKSQTASVPLEPGAPTEFALQDVIKAFGIPLGLANNWSARYQDVAISPSGRGRGRRRMVSAEAVARFALLKSLTNALIPPQDALGITQAILKEIAETRRHEPFVVWFYPDGHAAALPAHVEPEPGAETSLRIEVRQIIQRVVDALEAMAAD